MRVRLQKFLAEAGLGSRRNCEELITAGRATIDGVTAQLGATVEPDTQTVAVDGVALKAEPKEYWLLNKPLGVLSAVKDDRSRKTVTSLVPSKARIFPVGRLDLNSTGLLVLTNDGLLTERLLHPRYHVEKEYLVKVRGMVSEEQLRRLREGVQLDEGLTSPATVELTDKPTAANGSVSTLAVIIHEGRKRQVRRMLEAVGHRVTHLHRARFATLTDEGLAVGKARQLTEDEIADLRKMAGLL